jgi:hypothetical protein
MQHKCRNWLWKIRLQLHNNEKVAMSVHKQLQLEEPDFYHSRIFQLVPRWDKIAGALGDYSEI